MKTRKRPPTKGSFVKGRRYARQGGYRPNAGRPTNAELERKAKEQQFSEKFQQKIHDETLVKVLMWADNISKQYVKTASNGKSPATTRHAMEYIIPPLSKQEQKQSVTFVTSLPIEEI